MRSLTVFLLIALGLMLASYACTPDVRYTDLVKPEWSPPGWLFPLIWAPLSLAIAIAGWRLWRTEPGTTRSICLWLWGIQLGLGCLWGPLFFTFDQPLAALAIILALLVANAASFGWFRQVSTLAAVLFMPYAVWIMFTAAFTVAIVFLAP